MATQEKHAPILDRLPDPLKERLDPTKRYGLRVTLFAIAVVLVIGPFGILLREVTTHGYLTRLDSSAAENLHDVVETRPGLVDALEVISFIGSPAWFYPVLGVAVLYLWLKNRRRIAVFIVVTGILGGLVDTAVKVWVGRPRPDLENPVATAPDNSFPSGHAMMSTICYGLLVLVFLPLVPRRWRVPVVVAAVVVVALVGFSRLALGVHFITDVLGGFVLGLAWLVASTAAFSIWRTEEGKEPVEPLEGVEPESIESLKS